jgi:hypothetical protein
MNEAFSMAAHTQDALKEEIKNLRQLVDTQAQLLQAYKTQLDRIPAGTGAGSITRLKVPEPPTFSGTDNKMSLEDWLNQVTLYCSSSGIVTDHQKIVTALTRLRSPATTYMKRYFDDNHLGKDLGLWDKFVEELTTIYGRRDDKEGAKDELTQLWTNKTLANKDFIKYAEQYRTLARLVEYQDNIHIDKLRNVISQELQNALVLLEVVGKSPTKWEEYLELLLLAYKNLHPEKTKGSIFGTGNSKGNGNGNNEPQPMEIDMAKRGKGKTPEQINSQETKGKLCQICSAKGLKFKAKSHNTNDCYDKPGNENKRPAPKPSTTTPSTSGQGHKGKQPVHGDKKSFKARLLELYDELDNDESATPTETLNVNHTSITEIVKPMPSEKRATAQVNDVQEGTSKLKNQPKWVRSRQYKVDFPQGL